MIGHARKKFRAGLFVKSDELFRLPFVGLPFVVDILETELRRMAVFLDMEFVNLMRRVIHIYRIPVALFGLTLRTPVRPDAELGVAIPVRDLKGGKRFKRWFEWPGRDTKSRRRNNRHGRGRQRHGLGWN